MIPGRPQCFHNGGMKKLWFVCLFGLGLMTACNDVDDDGPSAESSVKVDTKEVGEDMEAAMERTGEALERGAEKTKDALEDAGNKIKGEFEDAKDALDDDNDNRIEVEVKKD